MKLHNNRRRSLTSQHKSNKPKDKLPNANSHRTTWNLYRNPIKPLKTFNSFDSTQFQSNFFTIQQSTQINFNTHKILNAPFFKRPMRPDRTISLQLSLSLQHRPEGNRVTHIRISEPEWRTVNNEQRPTRVRNVRLLLISAEIKRHGSNNKERREIEADLCATPTGNDTGISSC